MLQVEERCSRISNVKDNDLSEIAGAALGLDKASAPPLLPA
jgi:hypothetical protein